MQCEKGLCCYAKVFFYVKKLEGKKRNRGGLGQNSLIEYVIFILKVDRRILLGHMSGNLCLI